MAERKEINYTWILIAAIVVVGVLAAVYLLKGGSGQSDNQVTVMGSAEKNVMPDHVIVSMLVETSAKSADEAKTSNSLIYDNILAGLSKIGISGSDLETESYSIYPDYEWVNGAQRLKGYKVSNYVKIKTYDFDKTGKIVDAVADNGGLVSYINFELTLSKVNDYKAEVLAEATADAKNKAQAIASGAGKKLGDLVSVQTSDYNYLPYPLYKMAESGSVEDARAAAAQVSPKSLDISATITAVYELK